MNLVSFQVKFHVLSPEVTSIVTFSDAMDAQAEQYDNLNIVSLDINPVLLAANLGQHRIPG